MSKPLSLVKAELAATEKNKTAEILEDVRASATAKGREFAQPRVSLIIPALNEEKSIGSVLNDVPADLVDEVLVVDNGSTDRTASIAEFFGARVVSEPRRGYGQACLTGIAESADDSVIIAFLDADYSDFPQDLERILQPLFEGKAEMVIGTRTTETDSRSSLTPQQRWGNWLATTLVRLFWQHRYTDLGPFRAIRRDALRRLGMTDRNYGWTIEMQIKAVRQNLRITEVPVRYRVRIGRSKISGTVKGTILAGAKIIYTIFRYAVKK
jgi:glycosyltransferase involved in cell wall biosynthesis